MVIQEHVTISSAKKQSEQVSCLPPVGGKEQRNPGTERDRAYCDASVVKWRGGSSGCGQAELLIIANVSSSVCLN